MEVLKIILIVSAYTTCVAALILQLICYRKEIEYKETIFFSLSLLLLIAAISLVELSEVYGRIPDMIWEITFHILYLVLGVTTPVNIHTERIVKNVRIKNLVIIVLSILLALNLFAGYLVHYEKTAHLFVYIFLNASILYSMFVIMRSKPSLLVLHRERIEKRTAKIFLISLPVYASLVFADLYLDLLNGSLLDATIIISLIVTGLALSKLTDDFKRLTLFRPDNLYNETLLDIYKITSRESEVLDLLIKGDTYRVISEKLFISLPTVKTHVSNIYQKMNINNKVELINLMHK